MFDYQRVSGSIARNSHINPHTTHVSSAGVRPAWLKALQQRCWKCCWQIQTNRSGRLQSCKVVGWIWLQMNPLGWLRTCHEDINGFKWSHFWWNSAVSLYRDSSLTIRWPHRANWIVMQLGRVPKQNYNFSGSYFERTTITWKKHVAKWESCTILTVPLPGEHHAEQREPTEPRGGAGLVRLVRLVPVALPTIPTKTAMDMPWISRGNWMKLTNVYKDLQVFKD